MKRQTLQKKKKYISKDDALLKLQAYCAYQDRCHSEVRSKLLDLGIYGDDLEEIIVALIEDNFLNEERFAKSYARGKFRMKQWGRLKIRRELKFRKISDYCIRKAMEEIEEDDYRKTLKEVILKKKNLTKEPNAYKMRVKLIRYVSGRGYEMEVIKDVINELVF